MTISSSVRTAGPFTGTGANTIFPFTFKVFQASDLVVARTDTGLVQSTLTLSVDYTVTLNTDQNTSPGGNVTLLVALPVGYTLTLTSAVPLTQPASLTNAGGFFPKTIEDALDRLTIVQQQIAFNNGQTLRVPEVGGVSVLPAAASRASNLLGFDSSGNPVAVAPASGSAAALATDLTNSTLAAKGAGQLGFGAGVGYGVGTIGKYLNDMATTSVGGSQVGFSQSVAYAVGTMGKQLRDLGYIVDVPAGGVDATSVINATILAAHQAKANVLSQDETYSVVVRLAWGQDFQVAGPVLLPAGIVLDLNGSRLVGAFPTGQNTVYVNASASVIETGYYSAGAITTNRSASLSTQRVVGSGVMNGAIINANCGLNLNQFNERCFVENIEFNNCSAAIRANNSYYASFKRLVTRLCSQAAGQYAYQIAGAANAMKFEEVTAVGASRGLQVDATSALGVSLINCTFEEAYLANGNGPINGTGIYFASTAVSCAGWVISGCYFEGVQVAIDHVAGSGMYGIDYVGNFFTNCLYAVRAGQSCVRVGKWHSNSAPDGGGVIRNLIDFGTAKNNEVDVQIQVKSGSSPTTVSAFLSNMVVGNYQTIDSHSFWDDTAVAGGIIARAGAARAQLSGLGDFAWEGAQMLSKNLQIPFVSMTTSGANPTCVMTLDTQLTYDRSNMLCMHLEINDQAAALVFDCLIFGATVYPLAAFTSGRTVTVTNNAGNVRIAIGGLSTVGGFSCFGGVRHM